MRIQRPYWDFLEGQKKRLSEFSFSGSVEICYSFNTVPFKQTPFYRPRLRDRKLLGQGHTATCLKPGPCSVSLAATPLGLSTVLGTKRALWISEASPHPYPVLSRLTSLKTEQSENWEIMGVPSEMMLKPSEPQLPWLQIEINITSQVR